MKWLKRLLRRKPQQTPHISQLDWLRPGGVGLADHPHCNPEALHTPGTCEYCDLYPDRQAARRASGTPFTPAEANGWPGNVAQPRQP